MATAKDTAQNILDTLLSDTYTLFDLKNRIRLLKDFVERDLFQSKKEQSELSAQDASWLLNFTKNSLALKAIPKEKVEEVFMAMTDEINHIQPLVLFLAYELDPEHIEAIGRKLRGDLKHPILFDIKFDATLIAGAAFAYKGVYKDYSLKSQLEQKREEIIKIFMNL